MADSDEGFFPHSYFHVGIVVPDIESAMTHLRDALGLTFVAPHESEYGGDAIRVAYATAGPPYYEIIQGAPGSRWDTGAGPRMDHLGYFSRELEADVATLERSGLAVDIDGREFGARFTYHRSPALGMRIELIDEVRRESLLSSIHS